MNRLAYLTLLLILLVVGGSGASPAGAQNKRLVEVPISDAPSYAKRALVIGVDGYENAHTLTVCTQDARHFADLLKTRFGFTNVTVMTDDADTPASLRPTYIHLKRAFEALLDGVDADSEVVVFFSGHGVRMASATQGDADWLVPLDGDPSDVASTCINYNVFRQRLDTKQPRRALLVTDACRNLLPGKGAGPSGFGGKSLDTGDPGSEIAELFSCQPTQISREGLPADFAESVFTHYLIQGLQGDPAAVATGTEVVTFDSLRRYVRGMVNAYVSSHFNDSQLPMGKVTQGSMVLARIEQIAPPAPQIGKVDIDKLQKASTLKVKYDAELHALADKLDAQFKQQAASAMLTENEQLELGRMLGKSSRSDDDRARIKDLQNKSKRDAQELADLQHERNPTAEDAHRLKTLTDQYQAGQQAVQKISDGYRAQIKDLSDKDNAEFTQNVRDAIAAVARQKGFAAIFTSDIATISDADAKNWAPYNPSSFQFSALASEAIDVTDDVIQRMNQ